MIIFWLIGLAWVVCGVLSFGYSYSFLQNEFPLIAEETESGTFQWSLLLSLGGYVSLTTILIIMGAAHGLRFRRYKYVDGVQQP